ncbi:DUF3349 domain-containing protein [Pseudofrankia asymbiotica]|uniref:DUF3349 domain-containing protein n=1 Tax=Pseudofrankia asymbiotica TaxID=1834516 RepID=A0A1V2IBJ4_9ACTN|nr:DUF3349 domain-containing protein [Pseudofrankia asymbiotica]ONH29137.1 hypothetical protein BL253_17120 [Pseudofrankia asymbiotica]
MAVPRFLATVIGWLRAGYPEGVPEHDYVPLFALLARKLTSDELTTVADSLIVSGGHSPDAVHAAITAVTHQPPTEGDLSRVAARLAAGGWPLAEPDRETQAG